MNTTLFKKVDYQLSLLIGNIALGTIALPELQRPFVWKDAKVRDLFDSMYKGFPVGYLLFWDNGDKDAGRQIGVSGRQCTIPRLLVVDGQQRLTSLFSVLKGKKVRTEDFKERRIRIAFRPRDAHFEVTNPAIERDPEYIADISELWIGDVGIFGFVKTFVERLRKTREVEAPEEDRLADRIGRLHGLEKYPFVALELSESANEEEVALVFVRINSKGQPLNQGDFILTLLSVFWDEGRERLEEFCRQCRKPPTADEQSSPFNHFIHPDPDQILRVSVGLGFKRARLEQVYSLLRGKDMVTGEFSEQKRESQFEILKVAQKQTLDLTNWFEFMKALMSAGFRSRTMITSNVGVLYSYVMFLIGRIEFNMDFLTLRDVIPRWFFMSAITGRYSASPESLMESDLARLRSVSDSGSFVRTLDQITQDILTEDFWNIALVNDLVTSAARTPVRYAYEAALNLLGARVLFSNMKLAELLDPALKPKKSAVERHHLFPKAYLKKNGILETRDLNQLANYAYVEWTQNIEISDKAPSEYWQKELDERFKRGLTSDQLKQMIHWHALPSDWHNMDYPEFLTQRRKLMAGVIREGFALLAPRG